MPAVVKPKNIAIRINATVENNTPCNIFNRNTGDYWVVYIQDTPDGLVALGQLNNLNKAGSSPTAWASAHVLEIQVVGVGYGMTTLTLDSKQDQEVTVTVTSDDGP